MSSRLKLFAVIESILFLWFIFQLTRNGFLLLLLLAGFFLISRNSSSVKRKSNHIRIGVVLILFSVLSTQAIWAMLLTAVLFAIWSYGGMQILKGNGVRQPPWKQKEFVSVDTLNGHAISPEFRKMKWIGKDTIGRAAFAWEDINFTKFMGETIIDLGNTILPNKENTIMIRNGIGKVRILVPSEVGVTLHYSSMIGKLRVEEDSFPVKNEQVKWTEEHFEEKPRKLHIAVSILVGELEVISV